MTTERSGMSLDVSGIDRYIVNRDGYLELCKNGSLMRTQDVERFAARHAAVPDPKPLPDLMLASYHEAVGWNACRKAMLAQRDGGG